MYVRLITPAILSLVVSSCSPSNPRLRTEYTTEDGRTGERHIWPPPPMQRGATNNSPVDSMLADMNYQRGMKHLKKRELDKAIASFTQAIRIFPHSAELYTKRAKAHYLKGELDRALSDLKRAIDSDSRHAPAFMLRGLVKYALGNFDDAVGDYDKAQRYNPTYLEVYVNRGIARLANGQNDRAYQDISEALRLSPENADAMARSIAYGMSGGRASRNTSGHYFIQYRGVAYEKNPAQLISRLIIAGGLWERQRQDQAVEQLRKASVLLESLPPSFRLSTDQESFLDKILDLMPRSIEGIPEIQTLLMSLDSKRPSK